MHEIPDVVLPEPILPPCLAYEVGQLGEVRRRLADGLQRARAVHPGAIVVDLAPLDPIQIQQVGG